MWLEAYLDYVRLWKLVDLRDVCQQLCIIELVNSWYSMASPVGLLLFFLRSYFYHYFSFCVECAGSIPSRELITYLQLMPSSGASARSSCKILIWHHLDSGNYSKVSVIYYRYIIRWPYEGATRTHFRFELFCKMTEALRQCRWYSRKPKH